MSQRNYTTNCFRKTSHGNEITIKEKGIRKNEYDMYNKKSLSINTYLKQYGLAIRPEILYAEEYFDLIRIRETKKR